MVTTNVAPGEVILVTAGPLMVPLSRQAHRALDSAVLWVCRTADRGAWGWPFPLPPL